MAEDPDLDQSPFAGERVRAHVYVSGNVQGVYFRANTREAAEGRSVDGWVRNLEDGRVEAVFEGPEGSIEALVEWCRSGSAQATVKDVEVEFEKPQGLDGFEIRR